MTMLKRPTTCCWWRLLPIMAVLFGVHSSDSLVLIPKIHDWLQTLKLPMEQKFHDIRLRLRANISHLATGLKQCYDSEYAGLELDLFHESVDVKTVIHTILTVADEMRNATKIELAERAIVVATNLIRLVTRVVECVSKPETERSPSGLTSLALLSPKEFKFRLNPKLANKAKSAKLGAFHGPGCQTKTRLRRDISFDEESILERLERKYGRKHHQHHHQNKRNKSKGHKKNNESMKDKKRKDKHHKNNDYKEKKPLPEEFSWVDEGKVTEVKNQGQCGSCFIFGAMSTVESAYMIKHPNVRPEDATFSEQAVLNCIDDDNVCDNGGLPEEVYQLMEKRGVVDAEHGDRYRGYRQRCDSYKYKFKLKDYCIYNRVSVEEMKRMLMEQGPLAIGVDASDWTFARGVYYGDCSETINHMVSLVGWNQNNWIIKNSWGPRWGNRGYIELTQRGNKCGVRMIAGYPILD